MEKYLQDYIENTNPKDANIYEINELIQITKENVITLNIRCLLACNTKEYTKTEVQHIDLGVILSSLIHLQVFT